MSLHDLNISFDALGIATVLQRHNLVVPSNQRSYAWRKEHISKLYEDLSLALVSRQKPYFLGTIVLTRSKDGALEVADGQQLLATISTLISAIRDYLTHGGYAEKRTADQLTTDFLVHWSRHHSENVPKLRLNVEDADYFTRAILAPPEERTKEKATELEHGSRAYAHTVSSLLGIEQIGPLMLAVLEHLEPIEAARALEIFLSWSVRFLVAGGGGAGVLDQNYGLRARDVASKVITRANQLRDVMSHLVPSDIRFREAFATHRSTKSRLARYYLTSLEFATRGDSRPEIAYIEDPTLRYNLEHVLPQSSSSTWEVSADTAQAYHKRLGNMALLPPSQNVAIGNKAFSAKKPVLAECDYELTRQTAEYETWGAAQIDERQSRLAELAVRTWPL